MSFWVWAAIACLGGVGAITRFLVDGVIAQRLGRDFPFGTLIVNLTGTFVLGLLTGLAMEGNTLLLAGTATIGSYTTFSTWMLETHRLAEDGDQRAPAINAVFSVVAGVTAATIGHTIGARA
jgi:fluoride exporter